MVADPEGQELVARIHARKLESDLARQETTHARLVSEAAALGTRPEARFAWELVHEAAGIKARTISRLQQFITRHLIATDPAPQPSRLDRMDGIK
jgi:hypothetical protein